ncbi:hypothetical protein Rsub_07296 [Raphidocelis subcapitata]|uniref:Nuclear pore complex protein Nup85 n=1 Tax=Raphidocelis subcapitata TaxID=307507 RepID=A0A2V0P2C5_9CHLO|nr:hypothetical protein Rsub_07296 [Raphidocelis subcapitata]|eukprot:GBF94028.1 hypothetical protein Rsub_07296 [Raphidocelis subcapitata]
MALVPAAAGSGSGAPPDAIAAVPAAPGSRLFFTWGAGTQLQLCELQGGAGAVHHASTVAWSAPSMEQRRIAYDVLPLYRSLRQALQQDEAAPGARLALLRTYARSVRQILMTGGSDAEDGGCVLYEAAVWHLLELFFLEPEAAEGHFAELFGSWLATHGALLAAPGAPSLQERAEELRGAPRVDAEPSYWPLLARLLAVGQLEAAGGLLLAHPAYAAEAGGGVQRDALDRVFNLLRTTPRLRRGGAASAAAPDAGSDRPSDLSLLGLPTDDAASFRAARGAWGRRVRQLLGEGGGWWEELGAVDASAVQGLRALLSVMLGDERALAAAAANWAELLAALLLWRYTDASPQLHLGQLLASAEEQAGRAAAGGGGDGEGTNEPFLAFLRELLVLGSRLEVQGVVRLCTNSDFCSLWFVAHAYDILRGYPRAEALLARPLPHLGCDQVEMYTLHYVETLTGCDGTWQVAAEYLAWCPIYGADALESLLSRLPFSPDDPPSALKALSLCERHGLASAARALCARLAARAAGAGLPGAALRWALRGGDAARGAALAAPVVARLAAQLEQRAGSFQAAPLDLPELDELAPLLDCLPALAGWDPDCRDPGADGGAAGAGAGGDAAPRGGRGGGGGRVAHPELQLLRSFSQLQSALRALAAEHARQAAAAAREEERQQQQQRKRGAAAAGGGGGGAAGAAADSAALRAAYRAARRPVMDLLGLPLAPPPLRLPLLRLALPLLESAAAPFSRADVQRLIKVLAATLATLAAARADGVPPDDGAAAAAAAGGGDEAAGGKVGEVRLALARALARAHIAEASAEA